MGTISIEHGDRLFWLGRYTERVFTTLKSLERLYDKLIDRDPEHYVKYLECLGLSDTFGGAEKFLESFVYDKSNPNSVAFSLERAYDNGIVIREEISTEALSYLQLAMDKLEETKSSEKAVVLNFLPVEDILLGFWGSIHEYVYDEEIKAIILCGKSLEKLDLYIRFKYRYSLVNIEFERFCTSLSRMPKNTPYRYNPKYLSSLTEIIGKGDKYMDSVGEALYSLERLFSSK